MKVWIYSRLERLFARIEDWAGDQRTRFAICPDCGRNRYSGAPCKNIGPESI